MEELKVMLAEIRLISKDVGDIKISHEVLAAVNTEQHKNMNHTIQTLSDNIGLQNGRVSAVEKFINNLKTKTRTMSAGFGALGSLTVIIIAALALLLR